MKKNEKFELLAQITALDFSIIDLHLYLNTHPMDHDALERYNSLVAKCKMLRENYEHCYGMLSANSLCFKYPWQWVDEPWPWEYEANFKL
jgi:spore coat protein JB